MNAINAFLQGTLLKKIYLKPPEVINISSNKVLHLDKSIYGPKQSFQELELS